MTIPIVRKAVIPAAGHGTRLLPLTRSQPKEMVACGPAPVIQYVLDELRTAGIQDVLLISRSGKSTLEDFVFEAWPGACVIRQPEQKGLGDAVSLARSWVGSDPFVVALGDTIIHSSRAVSPLARMIQARPHAESSIVLVRPVPPELVSRYGVVAPVDPRSTADPCPPGQVFAVRDIIEKPAPEEAPSNLAIAGRYVFSPQIFSALADTLPGRGGEVQLTDAMARLGGTSGGMYACVLEPGEIRYDIGNLDSYYDAFSALAGIRVTHQT